MKKGIRILAAALAAVTVMTCTSANAFADKLRTSGGITYRYSDSGVKLGKYTGWAKNKTGRMYYKNGVKLHNKWLGTKSGKYYYVGTDGYARTGWSMAVRSGSSGKFSYFNSKGVWDGKTYQTGYEPRDLSAVFNDINFFGGKSFSYSFNSVSASDTEPFYDIYLVREITEEDLKTPLLWDRDVSDDETELADIPHNGTVIVIHSSKNDKLTLEFSKDSSGNSYLYNSYYGFGLRLSDSDAYDELADAIGFIEKEDDGGYDDLEPLDEEQERIICTDYLKYMQSKGQWLSEKVDDLRVRSYYGTYHGCEAVVVYGDELDMTDDIQEMHIAGYEITLSSGSLRLMLHRDGTFIGIADAYKAGILSKEDIAAISYYNNAPRSSSAASQTADSVFIEPPYLLASSVSTTGRDVQWTALKGTYSWGNAPKGSDLMTETEACGASALQSKIWLDRIDVKAGNPVSLSFVLPELSGEVKPDKLTVKCWSDKYFDDDSAYSRYETVTLNGSSFTPKKGSYVYEIYASWNNISTAQTDMSGSCYYSVYVNAK